MRRSRYVGVLDERAAAASARLWNPVQWLTAGVSWALALPVALLSSVGLIGSSSVRWFTGGWLFRVSSGALALLGLVGGVIAIIVDGREALEWLRQALGQLP